ncbi:hypothetical protein Nepgr_017738 [Nepenthes gracilis]|uniref:Uncharacterized protein n=1 Tax=Nepenthes gracilis TaxID=150966 RepID=A0AAD3XSF4_NEPGR|nr:hypothetical protein Nepgr_017738 [Nepenthes gracilis]
MRDANLVIIADSFPLSEELDISRLLYAVTDRGANALSSILGSLRKINLLGNYCISDASLISVIKCPNLIEIQVGYSSGVTSNGISSVLCNSKSLNSLVLSGKQINSAGMTCCIVCSRVLSTLVFGTMKILDELLDTIVR